MPKSLAVSLLSLSSLLLIAAAPGPAVPQAASASAPLPPPITPTEKTELFNGTDFTGWVSVLPNLSTTQPATPPEKVWSIHDGLIACVGKPNGYLRTEKSYTQYKLTVEWRFTKAGNTGVLVHINPVSPSAAATANKVWPMCIECQGAHSHQGDFWIWSGAHVDQPLQKRNGVIMTTPSAEKPVGEWNTYQVTCKDDSVTITVNGTEMNKVTGSNLKEGQLGIQSEGAGLEVRKITIEPLTP